MLFTTSPVQIRDTEFMWTVFRITMKQYITLARGEWDELREETQFKDQLDESASRLIFTDNTVAGFIMTPIKDGVRWIHTICILPEHQGKGLGTAVIRSVINQAQREGVSLYLNVLRVNPARKLYERMGFQVIDETRFHFKMRYEFVTVENR